MTYKGYTAQIEYSAEDGCLIGEIAGIRDIVGFHGDSVAELWTAFEEAVEDYLEMCEELERPPQKPYSGNLTLHIPPEVHIGIAQAAEASGKNLDQWATEAFTDALQLNSKSQISENTA